METVKTEHNHSKSPANSKVVHCALIYLFLHKLDLLWLLFPLKKYQKQDFVTTVCAEMQFSISLTLSVRSIPLPAILSAVKNLSQQAASKNVELMM